VREEENGVTPAPFRNRHIPIACDPLAERVSSPAQKSDRSVEGFSSRVKKRYCLVERLSSQAQKIDRSVERFPPRGQKRYRLVERLSRQVQKIDRSVERFSPRGQKRYHLVERLSRQVENRDRLVAFGPNARELQPARGLISRCLLQSKTTLRGSRCRTCLQ